MGTNGAWVVGGCFQEQFLVYFSLGPQDSHQPRPNLMLIFNVGPPIL